MYYEFFNGHNQLNEFPEYVAIYSECKTIFNFEILESLHRMDSAFFFIIYDNESKQTGRLLQIYPHDTLELANKDDRAIDVIKGNELLAYEKAD
ncbi:MAG: hypothetical protein R3321_05865 [Nitrososphaeraceae archaeon]|nr:hypothetical protein [Nitrososphaeraceae archaeon]